MSTDQAVELDQEITRLAMTISADGATVSVGRAAIDGAVVIYNIDDPPLWLKPILLARDTDGSVLKAMHVRASDEDDIPILVEYEPGHLHR